MESAWYHHVLTESTVVAGPKRPRETLRGNHRDLQALPENSQYLKEELDTHCSQPMVPTLAPKAEKKNRLSTNRTLGCLKGSNTLSVRNKSETS